MLEETMTIVWGNYSIDIPYGSLAQTGKKQIFRYKKPKNASSSLAAAQFDFEKGKFKLTIKNADLGPPQGDVVFALQFATFDQHNILSLTLKNNRTYTFP